MKMLITMLSGSALGLCGAANAQTVTGVAPPTAATERDQDTTNDIIVTASRRSENIRKVPTAVSAFTDERLRDTQVTSLADLTAVTPNVQISTYLTSANINIRGIGNGNFNYAGGDPGVAVHANGVYLGQPALALGTLLDMQRVEILRGPQGTLFGRNATGGAVNLIANTPTTNLSYGADISAGIDPTLVRSSGYISGPLNSAGTVLARLSAEQNYNRGFSRNLANGGPSYLDGNNDFAVRGQLEFRPASNFSLRLLGEYAKLKDSGPAAYLQGTPLGAQAAFPFPLLPLFGLPAINPIVPGPDTIGRPDSREAYANIGSRKMDSKTIDLFADWSIGGGQLKATLSYNESYNLTLQDGDGTSIPYTASYFTYRARQRYGELIYTSNADKPFSVVLGANYFHEYIDQDSQVPTLNYPIIYAAGGTLDTTALAAFGRAQYALGRAKLFAGLRYSHDLKKATTYNNLIPPNAGADKAKWSRVTYDVGISYDLSSAVTGYAKYATGYKGGGFSLGSFNPAFNPETNTSIELGLKGNFFGGVLQANVAGFHMKYSNLQVNQIVGLSTQVTNAARATIDGIEIESVLRPTRTLRMEASGSWLNARFDEFLTADSARPGLGALELAGNRLPGSPRFTASIGLFNDIPLAAGTVTLGGRYSWKDRLYFSEFNIPISSQSATGKLDLFVNFKSADRRWSASLFALNVTDNQVKANVTVVSALLGSIANAQYQPGRQVGVSLGYHF